MKLLLSELVHKVVRIYEKNYKHFIVALVGLVLFFIGGFALGVVGVLTTFFIYTLIKRVRKDSNLEASIENPFNTSNAMNDSSFQTDEPFEGALLVAAIGFHCTGSVEFAGMQMKKRFSEDYSGDWISLCRIASRSESLNGDLIVECLGATLRKTQLKNSTYEKLLIDIFTFLSIVEYDWDFERGVKPSEYLAELLQSQIYVRKDSGENNEVAYQLLGISPSASLETVKSAHRSLVSLYHPDTLGDLTDEQKKIAAEAFIRIQTAYESILATF